MPSAVNSFILGSRSYTVTATQLSVKDDLGRRRTLRRGDLVPPRTLPSTIDALLERGLIRVENEA